MSLTSNQPIISMPEPPRTCTTWLVDNRNKLAGAEDIDTATAIVVTSHNTTSLSLPVHPPLPLVFFALDLDTHWVGPIVRMLQVNGMAVYLRTRRGFQCLSLSQPYWQHVQSLGTGREAIPGNCNGFRYKKSHRDSDPQRGSNDRIHDATPVVRPTDELQTITHIA